MQTGLANTRDPRRRHLIETFRMMPDDSAEKAMLADILEEHWAQRYLYGRTNALFFVCVGRLQLFTCRDEPWTPGMICRSYSSHRALLSMELGRLEKCFRMAAGPCGPHTHDPKTLRSILTAYLHVDESCLDVFSVVPFDMPLDWLSLYMELARAIDDYVDSYPGRPFPASVGGCVKALSKRMVLRNLPRTWRAYRG